MAPLRLLHSIHRLIRHARHDAARLHKCFVKQVHFFTHGPSGRSAAIALVSGWQSAKVAAPGEVRGERIRSLGSKRGWARLF